MLKRLFKRKESAKNYSTLLEPGAEGPNFSLPATSASDLSLHDFRGQPVVLVFYPADKSPVCSNQLALYNEALNLFEENDAQILGISVDDIQSHQEFSDSLNLGFPLLSDDNPLGAIARAYGVYNERDKSTERALFVLDSNGTIRWSYLSPGAENPGANGILHALSSLESEK